MKNILIITPWCPFPEHKNGGVHTIYNAIKAKDENDVIDVLYYTDENKDEENGLSDLINTIFFVDLQKKDSKVLRLLSVLKGVSCEELKYRNINLSNVVNFNKYDTVILDQLSSLKYVKHIPDSVKKISMMHDSIPLYYTRLAESCKNTIKKIYYQIQVNNIKKTEEKFYYNMDKILFVSEYDAELTRSRFLDLHEKIGVVTLGVELPSVVNEVSNKEAVVFSGVMDYPPNEDAVIYFGKKIFPYLLEKYPNLTFMIVGKNPTDRIYQLQKESSNIVVTGFVDNMVLEITKAAIYISPLRIGSGVKNKVLEAMAAKLPVIMSPVSREGINHLKHGENCLFADTDDEWVKCVDELLSDPIKQQKIGLNGFMMVKKYHSWKGAFKVLSGD